MLKPVTGNQSCMHIPEDLLGVMLSNPTEKDYEASPHGTRQGVNVTRKRGC